MRDRQPPTRYIFVTGGVVSALGKGIAAASIGRLLVSRGLKVTIQKFDPYINVDPGTMSPFQHGEVFVTEDGAETDLDLGHYERFTDVNTTRGSNVTTGAIYDTIIRRERRGDFLGGTVQVIPHITDEIKQRIELVAEAQDVDFVITEIGGTVGDIESLPFLEALRQFQVERGTQPLHVRPPHAGPVPRPRRRAQDEAHPALGPGAPPDRHPAGHDHVPVRGATVARDPREDRAFRQRLRGRDDLGARRRLDLQGAALPPRRGGRRRDPRPLRARGRRVRPVRLGGARAARRRRGPDRADRPRRQVREARGRLPVGDRGAQPRRAPPRGARRDPLDRRRGPRPRGGRPGARGRATAS